MVAIQCVGTFNLQIFACTIVFLADIASAHPYALYYILTAVTAGLKDTQISGGNLMKNVGVEVVGRMLTLTMKCIRMYCMTNMVCQQLMMLLRQFFLYHLVMTARVILLVVCAYCAIKILLM